MDLGVLVHLPEQLSYLAEPAIRFNSRLRHGVCTELHVLDFLDGATDDEMEELAGLAEKVLLNQHYPLVNEFLHDYPITEYDECASLYCLFGIMDHADLRFE